MSLNAIPAFGATQATGAPAFGNALAQRAWQQFQMSRMSGYSTPQQIQQAQQQAQQPTANLNPYVR